jgi:hypothetical protein
VELVSSGFAIAALAPWLDRERKLPPSLAILGAMAALAAAISTYGFPSLAGVQRDLRAGKLGRYSEDVLAAGCTHLAGNYWKVWPTILHVGMLRHAAGRDAELWGITFRSTPTREMAQRTAGRPPRVCMLPGVDQSRLATYAFGALSLVERRGAIDVYEPSPASPRD